MKAQPQRRFKYAFTFAVLALGALAAMVISTHWLLKIIAFNAALAFAGVSLGYGMLGPRVFGKQGPTLSWWAWLIYWPYLALNYLSLWLFRRASGEAPWHEIAPGLVLGCRLWQNDEHMLPEDIEGVLDLTAEFSETRFLKVKKYRCIPVLDTTAPTLEELMQGVLFLEEAVKTGTVYIHCALGHGRSATFAAAYLLSTGQMKSVEEALARLQKIRPGVDLHLPQRRLLEAFQQSLHGH